MAFEIGDSWHEAAPHVQVGQAQNLAMVLLDLDFFSRSQ